MAEPTFETIDEAALHLNRIADGVARRALGQPLPAVAERGLQQLDGGPLFEQDEDRAELLLGELDKEAARQVRYRLKEELRKPDESRQINVTHIAEGLRPDAEWKHNKESTMVVVALDELTRTTGVVGDNAEPLSDAIHRAAGIADIPSYRPDPPEEPDYSRFSGEEAARKKEAWKTDQILKGLLDPLESYERALKSRFFCGDELRGMYEAGRLMNDMQAQVGRTAEPEEDMLTVDAALRQLRTTLHAPLVEIDQEMSVRSEESKVTLPAYDGAQIKMVLNEIPDPSAARPKSFAVKTS